MGQWTNYPNGISVTTATGSVAGHINGTTGSFTGTFTVGTLNSTATGTGGSSPIGARQTMTFSFTSAATTTYYLPPFSGNIVDIVTTSDTTPRTCSGFTVTASSAGTVAVASVALAFATAVGQTIRPAFTSVAVTTALAFNIIVTTAGSAANFVAAITFEKTA